MKLFKCACIFSLILTACTPPKPMPDALSKQKPLKTQSSNTLTSWEISGAIAAKQHKKGWASSLNWHQQGPEHYQIRLFGPLGGGTVIIEKRNGLVTYRDGPKVISSPKADSLLQEQTGIRLPVNNLYYWVRGIPAPGNVQASRRDNSNRLTSLNQAGYTIRYNGYTTVNQIALPTKISVEGHDIRIKLVIKHWML